jgi:hypothetical protein
MFSFSRSRTIKPLRAVPSAGRALDFLARRRFCGYVAQLAERRLRSTRYCPDNLGT